MTAASLLSPDLIRTRFSQAMSAMYRQEVPQYGTLLELVAEVNAGQPGFAGDSAERLDLERHGAIRVGTAAELATLRRLFAVMGMRPNLIAARWNFADFQSTEHGGVSAIQMELTTQKEHGREGSGSGGVVVVANVTM